MPRQADPELLDPGTQVMPTLYLTERFFVRPVTTRGDTVTLFTDTGDYGRLFQAQVEKLRKDAADCALIRDLATQPAKREMFDRLAHHLTALADQVEMAMLQAKTGTEE